MTDNGRKGYSNELHCMAELVKYGCDVSIPYGNGSRYDVVVDFKGHTFKVQCKHSKLSAKSQGSFEFEVRSKGRYKEKSFDKVYTKEQIDYFATWFDGKCYLVPVEECGTSVKALRFAPCLTKCNEHKANWASDYELGKVLGELEEKWENENM